MGSLADLLKVQPDGSINIGSSINVDESGSKFFTSIGTATVKTASVVVPAALGAVAVGEVVGAPKLNDVSGSFTNDQGLSQLAPVSTTIAEAPSVTAVKPAPNALVVAAAALAAILLFRGS